MIEAVAQCIASKLKIEVRVADDALTISPDPFSGSDNWTREQLKLAFHFYCQTPFVKLDRRNRNVIALASLIGRTPGALAMKLVNFASLDPAIRESGRAGLSNASRLDRKIWDEFHADWEGLALECELLHQQLMDAHGLQANDKKAQDGALADFTGETRAALVQQRVKQQFFRRAVLSGYRGRCCISGLADERLLAASHIVPWSEDKGNRLNPSNGLCLSSIHDKAFDNGLIGLTDDFRVLVSDVLLEQRGTFSDFVFHSIVGKPIEMPERFTPDIEFIAHHRARFFCTRLRDRHAARRL